MTPKKFTMRLNFIQFYLLLIEVHLEGIKFYEYRILFFFLKQQMFAKAEELRLSLCESKKKKIIDTLPRLLSPYCYMYRILFLAKCQSELIFSKVV